MGSWMIAVARPDDLPRQQDEVSVVLHDDGCSRSYWTASASVSNAIGCIDNAPLRAWVCRTLNAAVLRGEAP